MDLSSVGKAIERVLRGTECLIAAYTPGDVLPGDPRTSSVSNEYNESLRGFLAVFGQLRSEMTSATDRGRPAACARAWLDACLKKKLFKRMEELFRVITTRTAAAARAGAGEVVSR